MILRLQCQRENGEKVLVHDQAKPSFPFGVYDLRKDFLELLRDEPEVQRMLSFCASLQTVAHRPQLPNDLRHSPRPSVRAGRRQRRLEQRHVALQAEVRNRWRRLVLPETMQHPFRDSAVRRHREDLGAKNLRSDLGRGIFSAIAILRIQTLPINTKCGWMRALCQN